MPDGPEVRRVDAAVTAPLRRRVLRPGALLPLPGDDDPGAVHLAAYDGEAVVGSANVRREPAPFLPGEEGAWRLRGMACDPTGTGTGALVLAAAVAHVRAAGGRLLWANARTPALRFYERHGFAAVGDPWDDPEIGPHVAVRLDL